MTEQQKEKILLSINEKLDKQSKQFELISEKIENRDDLLISITKEVALLRNDVNQKFKKEN